MWWTCLKGSRLLDAKPSCTPLKTFLKLEPSEGEPSQDQPKYRRIVGKLIRLTLARLLLSFVVSVVSLLMQNPWTSYWKAVVRMLRYLRKCPSRRMLYAKEIGVKPHEVQGYVDWDWFGSSYDRWSTSGYCITLGGNVVI